MNTKIFRHLGILSLILIFFLESCALLEPETPEQIVSKSSDK